MPSYHKEKSKYAKSKGIFIYHIFEFDWENPTKREIIESQIKSLIHKQDTILYARNCILSNNISSQEASKFLKINHMQGSRGSQYRYGLYYNNELVALMTFGENYFIRRTHDLELLRFCTKLYTNVIGGASKLFNHFIQDHDYPKIYTFCDLSKGTGNLYNSLGFDYIRTTPPNYKWTRWKDQSTFTRYQCQMKNEIEIMESQGYVQVWDCGNAEYLYSEKEQ